MPRILTRFITPKRAKTFDPNIFVQQFKEAYKEEKKEIIKDFEGTVFGWSNKPGFSTRFTVSSNEMNMFVFPTGATVGKGGLSAKDQYLIVNRGVDRHIILPKKSSSLVFKPGYRASTRPGSIGSRRNFRSGKFVTAKAVMHPGYFGRDFFGLIGKKHKLEWKRQIENAIRRAITRSKR